jgi:3-octaprenyl-4-hydroxybenzoate carboxy-lyase
MSLGWRALSDCATDDAADAHNPTVQSAHTPHWESTMESLAHSEPIAAFPAAKRSRAEILAGRRRTLHRNRRHHLHARPDSNRINVGCYRQMLHGRNRVGMYCSPGKHGRLDREAWWRDGKPCEVVAVYGIDPVLFMVAAQTFNYKLPELEVAGGIMGHPLELTQAEFVSLPIPARRDCHRGIAASRRYRDGGPARRVHRLLRQ